MIQRSCVQTPVSCMNGLSVSLVQDLAESKQVTKRFLYALATFHRINIFPREIEILLTTETVILQSTIPEAADTA